MIKGRCKFLKDWPDWDIDIHEEKEQIERQTRSKSLKFGMSINGINNTGTFVSSMDIPDYKTTLNSCTCEDFKERNLPCKHMYRLATELEIIELIKRPSYDKKVVNKIKSSDNIDSELDQIKRQKSALKCKPIEIDHENKCGTFKGSGKSPYHTTLEDCTCRDFTVRNLPCKHIYRLRMELENPTSKKELQENLNSEFEKDYGKDLLRKLSQEAATAYIYSISFDWSSSSKIEEDILNELVKSELVEISKDLTITLKFLQKKDLFLLCDKFNISYKNKFSKDYLISLITENVNSNDLASLVDEIPFAIRRNKKAENIFGSIKYLYHKLYPTDYSEYTVDF